MKAEISLLFFLLVMTGFCHAQTKEEKTETYDWSHSWIVTKPGSTEKPSILLIGDSHVERYYPVVATKLKEKINVSKITTSKSMGDPQLINQLTGLLGNYQFDVICFNNGLHGVKYNPEEYAKYLPVVYKLLKKNNPNAKIIWITTTARRMSGDLDNFDQYNKDVELRNKHVVDYCVRKNIEIIDFYDISLRNINYYSGDGIHFNEAGVEAQAQMIVDKVLKYCKE